MIRRILIRWGFASAPFLPLDPVKDLRFSHALARNMNRER